MKLELTALDIHWLLRELKELEGGRVNKIYSPVKGEYLFLLWIPRLGKKYLRFILPSILFLDDVKGEQEVKPSSFVMFLRKRLMNSKVVNVEQIGFERILRIDFEKEKNHSLVFELFGKGNIILLDEDGKVVSALERQTFKDRDVTKGVLYDPPLREHNVATMDEPELKAALASTKQGSLVKFCAIDLGLGGAYSEEACARAKLDKTTLPTSTTRLYKAIQSILTGEPKPTVYLKGAEVIAFAPFELETKENESKSFKEFAKAIRETLGKVAKHSMSNRSQAALQKKIQKYQHAYEMQSEALKKLQESAETNQKQGEYIYENYPKISKILDELRVIRKKHSWKEIKETLKDHKIIKDIDEKTGDITIELN